VSAKSQSKNLGDIIVNSVTVENENGSIVGRLKSMNNNGVLYLNKSGAKKVSLALFADEKLGGTLVTRNSNGEMVTFLGADSTGSGHLQIVKNNRPSTTIGDDYIRLSSALGSASVVLRSDPDGSGAMQIYNGDEKTAVLIQSQEEGGQILTLNPKEQTSAMIATTEQYGGVVSLYNSDEVVMSILVPGSHKTTNENGILTSSLGTNEGSAGGVLETFNEHGERIGYFGNGKSQDGIVGLFDRYGDAGWSASGKK
jgi:hypothetical protein